MEIFRFEFYALEDLPQNRIADERLSVPIKAPFRYFDFALEEI